VRRSIVNPHAVEKDVSGGWPLETAYNPERGGFAAPARAQQCEEFFIVNMEIQAVQNNLTVKRHRAIRKAYQLFGHLSSPIPFNVSLLYRQCAGLSMGFYNFFYTGERRRA
jgi:hypothetical protein